MLKVLNLMALTVSDYNLNVSDVRFQENCSSSQSMDLYFIIFATPLATKVGYASVLTTESESFISDGQGHFDLP